MSHHGLITNDADGFPTPQSRTETRKCSECGSKYSRRIEISDVADIDDRPPTLRAAQVPGQRGNSGWWNVKLRRTWRETVITEPHLCRPHVLERPFELHQWDDADGPSDID